MKKLPILVVVLVAVSSSSLGEPAYLPQFGHFAILIHDVSPVYLPQLRQMAAIIDHYGLQNETYLFVIPDHAGEHPIGDYPEFVAFLRNLSGEGYHVELHGYDHIGDEFECDGAEAKKRLDLGLGELEDMGFSPEYFIAPRYAVSDEALEVLLGHNLTVIGGDFIYLPNGTVEPVLNREYTWYLTGPLLNYQLESARASYRNTKGTFFLSIHPKAANSGAGMEFLEEFLKLVWENWKDGLG
ncbi:DUF2334 domain-containing protein [Thermococcus sp. M36]|uniref:DUF2334 domain-containing protein n=1 Tax=Thermococcus sp. M36 TaxID=1638261 RepID=UPI001438D6E9|nr:DUF2334 domain-containing protein [Thermococcus sp. M36]NJE06027.1 DUF2334 domain-containing protein [Thermococcus sp. M36]